MEPAPTIADDAAASQAPPHTSGSGASSPSSSVSVFAGTIAPPPCLFGASAVTAFRPPSVLAARRGTSYGAGDEPHIVVVPLASASSGTVVGGSAYDITATTVASGQPPGPLLPPSPVRLPSPPSPPLPSPSPPSSAPLPTVPAVPPLPPLPTRRPGGGEGGGVGSSVSFGSRTTSMILTTPIPVPPPPAPGHHHHTSSGGIGGGGGGGGGSVCTASVNSVRAFFRGIFEPTPGALGDGTGSEGGESDSDMGSVASERTRNHNTTLGRSLGRFFGGGASVGGSGGAAGGGHRGSRLRNAFAPPTPAGRGCGVAAGDDGAWCDMCELGRDLVVPLRALRLEVTALQGAVAALSARPPEERAAAAAVVAAAAGKARCHVSCHVTAMESVVHPWIARRAAVPRRAHGNHTAALEHADKLVTVLGAVAGGGPLGAEEAGALRTAATALVYLVSESFRAEARSLTRLADAHFTARDYTPALVLAYWSVWCGAPPTALPAATAAPPTAAAATHASAPPPRARGWSLFGWRKAAAPTDGVALTAPGGLALHPSAQASVRGASATAACACIPAPLSETLPWLTSSMEAGSVEEEWLLARLAPWLPPSTKATYLTEWRPRPVVPPAGDGGPAAPLPPPQLPSATTAPLSTVLPPASGAPPLPASAPPPPPPPPPPRDVDVSHLRQVPSAPPPRRATCLC